MFKDNRKGRLAGSEHGPERLREIVRSPAELVGVVEGVGQELVGGILERLLRLKGLMVGDGPNDGDGFPLAQIEICQDPGGLLGTPFGMILFPPPDIVKKPGQVRQSHELTGIRREGLALQLDQHDGAGVQGHLSNVGQPVAVAVTVTGNDSQAVPDHRRVLVQAHRLRNRFVMMPVEFRVSHLRRDFLRQVFCPKIARIFHPNRIPSLQFAFRPFFNNDKFLSSAF